MSHSSDLYQQLSDAVEEKLSRYTPVNDDIFDSLLGGPSNINLPFKVSEALFKVLNWSKQNTDTQVQQLKAALLEVLAERLATDSEN